MKRKILAFLLLFTMLGVSACGADTDKANSTEKRKKENVSEQGGKEAEDSEGTFTYVQPEMKGEITIATMYEQEFLKTAAESFMTKYPDITITINNYQGSGGENAVEEWQTSLNTKIMSKTAEDIIFTTQIPMKKYMDMGVFLDLSDYIGVTPEMNDENYFLNVLEAAKDKNGHIYVVPYMASFQAVSFDGEVLSNGMEKKIGSQISYSKAVELAKQMVDASNMQNLYLTRENELSYMNQLIAEYQNTLIDMEAGKVNINTEQYINWINEVEERKEQGDFGKEGSINYYKDDYCYAMTCDYDVQSAYYLLANKSAGDIGVPLVDESGEVYTNSAYCMGINSESGNKELAWEFIKYLLSEEVQTLPSIHGLAINKTGFESSVNRFLTFYQSQDEGTGNVEAGDYKDILSDWMLQISKCDMLDPIILNFFDEENKKFFDGSQTAQNTAKTIQNKVTQYLNE